MATFNGTDIDDNYTGTSGDDVINGGGGDDVLNGAGGNDTIDGGSGQDQIFGEDGDDTIIVSDAPVAGEIYDGGAGIDTLRVLNSAGTLTTNAAGQSYQVGLGAVSLASIERLEFGSVDDTVLGVSLLANQIGAGLSSTAEIVGGAGVDQLTLIAFAAGSYTLPTFTYSNWTNADEAFEQGDGVALLGIGNNDYTLNAAAGHLGVQALIGAFGNDVLNGTDGLEVLNGGGGVNILNAAGGDDVLVAVNNTNASGFETFFDFAGNVYNGGTGFDWLSVGGFVNFRGDLNSIEGINFQAAFDIDGGSSQDYAELEVETAAFDVLPAALSLRGTGTLSVILDENESLDASGWVHTEGSDVRVEFFGGDGSETVIGTSGDDRFSGGFGADTFTGGEGVDQFEAGEGQHTATDFIVGEDLVDLQDMNITSFEQLLPFLSQVGSNVVFSRMYAGEAQTMTLLNVDLGDLTAESFVFQQESDDPEGDERIGTDQVDDLIGAYGDDYLDGLAGDDYLYGGDGDDTLRGGLGNDELYGGAGDDLLSEASGNDGPFGNDLYDGGDGVDRVSLFSEFGPGVTVDLRITTAQDTGSQGVDTFIDIEQITSNYGDDTLIGNEADNWFWTFSGTDILSGNGGDDLFTVGQGTKIVDGGDGIDTIEINDFAFVPAYTADGVTVSLLLQGSAQETGVGLWTLTAMENLAGWWGNDDLTGDDNDNVLAGGEGDDTLRGGAGNDVIAGDGAFLLFKDAGPIEFVDDPDWQDGNDFLEGGLGDDLLVGAGGDDFLAGGADDDTVDGGQGRDQAQFLLTEDLRGTWTLAKNADGSFTVSLTRNGSTEAAFELSYDSGTWTVTGVNAAAYLGTDTLSDVEEFAFMFEGDFDPETSLFVNLAPHVWEGEHLGGILDDVMDFSEETGPIVAWGNYGDDTITGTAAADTLNGAEDNDILSGLGGDDFIIGGEGDDEVLGGDGSDLINGNAGDDVLDGGDGDDFVRGAAGNDSLHGGAGDDNMRGGSGVDSFDGGASTEDYNPATGYGDRISFFELDATQGVVADLRTGIISNDGFGNVETMTNIESLGADTAFVDTLYGNDASNALLGNRGDFLYGFGGNDYFYSTSAAASIDGGDGVDLLAVGAEGGWSMPDSNGDGLAESAAAATAGWNVDLSTGVMIDGYGNAGSLTGVENVEGSALDDTIVGDEGANVLRGGAGNDQLSGGAGDDSLDGADGTDTAVYANAGAGVTVSLTAGTATGGDGNDTLSGIENVTGSEFNDLVFADGGANILIGNGGNDVLRAGEGDDFLYGGDGNDFLSQTLGEAFAATSTYGNDYYDGGDGIDRVTLFTTTGPGVTVDLNLTTAQNTGAAGIDTFIGIEHLTATFGNDTLIGTAAANWFWTFAGTDNLSGNGGNDYFTVGYGNKTINGGADIDTVDILDDAFVPLYTADGVAISLLLQGQAQQIGIGSWTLTSVENLGGSFGSDELTGDANANILAGGQGADTLLGGGGDDILAGDGAFDIDLNNAQAFFADPDWEGGKDTLEGGSGNDTLYGGGGNDSLDGDAGADSLYGGTGDDILYVDNIGDQVIEDVGEGVDTVRTSISYVLGDNVEQLRLLGSASISATGNSLDNLLVGNAGHNTLDGGTGSDTMKGGAGNDIYYVNGAGDLVTELTGEGTDTVRTLVSYTLGANVEQLRLLGTSSISATGNALDNLLVGNVGNNTLDGAAGADSLKGDAGNDVYYVDNSGDQVVELAAEGTDTVRSTLSYVLGDNVEQLRLLGEAAINGTGNSLNNLLVGNIGNNSLDGAAGADTMRGDAGDDIYYVDSSGDQVVELVGEGVDTVRSTVSYVLGDNVEQLRLLGTASIDATGNELNNTLVGNTGNNTLDGGTGGDTMKGGAGNDIYYVNSSRDVVSELAGEGIDTVRSSVSYTLGANVEQLRLLGTASISATGNSLDNLLVGNTGNNTLTGGGGTDRLKGDAGADTFLFNAGHFGTTAATADVILDFSHAEGDLISLSRVDANSKIAGDQAFTFIGTGAFSKTAGELRYQQINGDTYVSGDTNGDGTADFLIALDGLHTLTGGDFIM